MFYLQKLGLLCKLEYSSKEEDEKPKKTTFYLIVPKKNENTLSLTLMMKSIITRSILLNDDILEYQYEDEYLMSSIDKNKQKLNDFHDFVVKKV